MPLTGLIRLSGSMARLDNTKFHTQGYLVDSIAADANATVLYTCPNNFSAIVRYLHISNNNPSNKKVYVQFYHKDDDQYHYIANGLSMPGHSVDNLVNGGFFNLHAGDKIVAYSETTNTMDIMVSVEEYYDPSRNI